MLDNIKIGDILYNILESTDTKIYRKCQLLDIADMTYLVANGEEKRIIIYKIGILSEISKVILEYYYDYEHLIKCNISQSEYRNMKLKKLLCCKK